MGRHLAGETVSARHPLVDVLNRPGTSVAVVGATDHPRKYGGIIYRHLKQKGFKVFPVNPNRATVDGDPAFANLTALPERPTIVDFVVPPNETLKVLHECLEVGLRNVWIQPGAEDERVLAFLKEHGFNYLAHACIMVESRPQPSAS